MSAGLAGGVPRGQAHKLVQYIQSFVGMESGFLEEGDEIDESVKRLDFVDEAFCLLGRLDPVQHFDCFRVVCNVIQCDRFDLIKGNEGKEFLEIVIEIQRFRVGCNTEEDFLIFIWKSMYIYKIKVLSVHWSKSRHILVAHVSNKVMNENTLNKMPVCLSVCFRGFREKLFTIHVKTAEGIIMKFHIWIRFLIT